MSIFFKKHSLKKTERSENMKSVALRKEEREQYYIEMQEYLDMLKSLEPEVARVIARKNLVKAGIVDLNGKLTERYAKSREFIK